jgi:hypothetical protein
MISSEVYFHPKELILSDHNQVLKATTIVGEGHPSEIMQLLA